VFGRLFHHRHRDGVCRLFCQGKFGRPPVAAVFMSSPPRATEDGWVEGVLLVSVIVIFFLGGSILVGNFSHLPWADVFQFLIKAFPRVTFHYFGVLLFPLHLETWPPIFSLSPLWPLHDLLFLAIVLGIVLLPGSGMGRFSLSWFSAMLIPRLPAMIHNQVL